MTGDQPPRCRFCRVPVQWVAEWWEHVDGTVACNPTQRSHPPRGTNAAPEESVDQGHG
ncbi:hypothetical protein GCM10027589_24130 [Actinocorallia lasiicapitis]